MAEKPILFNTEMVKAILDGRKTQTRRLVKDIPLYEPYFTVDDGIAFACDEDGEWHPAEAFSRIQPGDVLWVRETWAKDVGRYMYRANYSDTEKFYMNGREIKMVWRPSIHMPREAARLFLRVKGVQMERLQDMSEDDAIAEGYRGCDAKHPVIYYPDGIAEPCWVTGHECIYEYWYCNHTLQEGFGRDIWDGTIKKADIQRYGWDANPWVWVIEFERLDGRPAGRYADRDTAQYGDQDVLMPAT